MLVEQLQFFVSQRANDMREVSQLIMYESKSIKEQTAREHQETRDNIMEHETREHRETRDYIRGQTTREHAETREHLAEKIVKLNAVSLSKAERSKFLKSLDFPGRDQRLNEVKDAHYKTFEWLFDEMDDCSEAQDGNSSDEVDSISEEDRDSDVPRVDPSSRDQKLNRDVLYEIVLDQCKLKTWDSLTEWLKSDRELY